MAEAKAFVKYSKLPDAPEPTRPHKDDRPGFICSSSREHKWIYSVYSSRQKNIAKEAIK